jgi:hypothetical protein
MFDPGHDSATRVECDDVDASDGIALIDLYRWTKRPASIRGQRNLDFVHVSNTGEPGHRNMIS